MKYVGATLDERAAECMRYYDHAKLARMYVSMIRDFCEMQTAVCRIMQESTDPAAAKIARDAFMCNPPKQ